MSAEQEGRILLVEDDPNFGPVLKSYLSVCGLSIDLFQNGEDAIAEYQQKSEAYRLCIIDVMLPKMGGHDVAREIKKIDSKALFLFLTAKSSDEDLREGYKLGAVDYLTKPFDSEILLMKVSQLTGQRTFKLGSEPLYSSTGHSSISASNGNKNQKWTIGDYAYDSRLRTLQHEKTDIINLTGTENELLKMLIEKKDDVLNREEALAKIWGSNDEKSDESSRSMDVFITRLRKCFSYDTRIQIKNIYKLGFRIVIEEGEITLLTSND